MLTHVEKLQQPTTFNDEKVGALVLRTQILSATRLKRCQSFCKKRRLCQEELVEEVKRKVNRDKMLAVEKRCGD